VTRILYIEDNDDNVYALKLRFGLLDGFEELIAENGETRCAMGLRSNLAGLAPFLTSLQAIARADFHATSCAMRIGAVISQKK
jgi:hypothetical protein